MPIPLEGQGEPLPKEFSYAGEWLIRDRIFLYVPDQVQASPPHSQHLPVLINQGKPNWLLGFDGIELARELKVTVSALFDANKTHDLILDRIMSSNPDGSGAIKAYIFRLGAEEAAATVDISGPSGTA